MPKPEQSSSPHPSPGASATHATADFLTRIEREGAVTQLRRRAGAMLRLGSDNGAPMLDWVEAVPRLLADLSGLESVELAARAMVDRGIRHVIWSGMGGSVLSVRMLRALGFAGGEVTVHPLDSTDPAMLNHLVRRIAEVKGLALPEDGKALDGASAPATLLRALFTDVLMVAVAMGKTSEEPITHVEWFADLLQRAELESAQHLLVMSIPDSFLEQYAQAHRLPHLPLQLDGGRGTPGRMSAPATRVFLLPAALDLAVRGTPPGTLRSVLGRAWNAYDLDGAERQPRQHPYVRLAAAMAGAAAEGRCGLMLALPPELDALRWWTEQLMEESLGKGGKGVIVFSDQSVMPPLADRTGRLPLLRLHVEASGTPGAEESGPFAGDGTEPVRVVLRQPLLAAEGPEDRLAGIAATLLGLQLSMALYGYLCAIPFAGQPAVEQYKSRARELRAHGDPLGAALAATRPVPDGRFTLLPPPGGPQASGLVTAMTAACSGDLTYLDLTLNGELDAQAMAALDSRLRRLGNTVLRVPVKQRRAPASYHSTEQSEMDGPPGVISLRALARRPADTVLGQYDATFLWAQAVGTWMAMNEAGRACHLLLYEGGAEEMAAALCEVLDNMAATLSKAKEGV